MISTRVMSFIKKKKKEDFDSILAVYFRHKYLHIGYSYLFIYLYEL